MAGTQDPDADMISGINVTPLVDVVLVVLIIFIVTTTYIVRAQIQVDLPRAASGQSEVAETLVFQVTEGGEYVLDGDRIELDQLGPVIESKQREHPELRAVIAGDKNVRYGSVVDLIDRMKIEGLDQFALNIERSSENGDGGDTSGSK